MFKPFYDFLIFCSGCDPDILTECPKSEKIKFGCIGATVLFTGVLACFSGGYAFYTIFQDLLLSIPLSMFFGILWGAIIFNLDRYLVSSLKKQGNIKRELLLATPRFLMAIIISVVVSKPLEVRIFQERIATQIYDNKNDATLQAKKKLDTIFSQSVLGNRLTLEESNLKNLQEKIDKGDPETPQFADLLNNLEQAKVNLRNVENTNNRNINEINKKIEAIRRERITYDERNVPKLPPDAQNEIRTLNLRKRELSADINNKAVILRDLQDAVSTQREAYRTEINQRIANTEKNLNAVVANKSVSDSLANIESKKADISHEISFKNTFITEVEALGNLTGKPFSTMWWTSIVISALILLIEVSPLLTKLLSERGPYDEKLQTRDEKIAAYENAERKINIILAEGVYLSDSVLLKTVEHYKATAEQSTNTLLEFVNSNVSQSNTFDKIITEMEEDIQKIGDSNLKSNYINNQAAIIEIYDNYRNKLFQLYRRVIGSKGNL